MVRLDVARLAGEIERELAGERMDASLHLDGRDAVDARGERDVTASSGSQMGDWASSVLCSAGTVSRFTSAHPHSQALAPQ